ncbi:hypothetical protein HHI36_009655 [Cryptolaemus montrouzieri]|uniref:Uncharacterized protein n=1 Tax=Cryptolaemus montrouzieri TaxID=559131 RepID=A0ABD2MH49_9CUCU
MRMHNPQVANNWCRYPILSKIYQFSALISLFKENRRNINLHINTDHLYFGLSRWHYANLIDLNDKGDDPVCSAIEIILSLAALAFAAEEKASSAAESKDTKAAEPASDDKNQKKRGLELGSYHDFGGDFGGHGLDLGGHDFGGHHEIKTVTIEKKVPYPVPHPVPYTVYKKVPVPYKVIEKVPVDRPYPVPVPKPYPVTVHKPVPYPVEKPYPVPVKIPIKVPVKVPYPVPVPKPYPVTVHKPYPVKVKVPIIIEKKVPIIVKDHHDFGGHSFGGHSFGHGFH